MATFSTSIAASSDDAMQTASTVTLADTFVGHYYSGYWVGLRFTNVTIPAGATITAATINVSVPSTSYDDPDLRIYAEATDDAATFTKSSNDISNRTRTTAYTTWSATGIGTGYRTSPDFTAVIQEIIDRGGWSSGNDIALILDAQSSAKFDFRSYDNGSDYPSITIEYTTTVNVDLDKLSLTAAVRPMTVVPGAVARVLDLLVADIAVQSLAVMPGEIATLLDLLGINGLAHSLEVVPGGVAIDLSRIAALLDALWLWPSVAGADIAIELARLPAAIAAKPLLVVPGMAAVDLTALAASLSALPLTVSYQASDLIIQLLRLSIAAVSSPLTVAPGEATVPLALQQATLTQINLLVFMLLGCAMATDRERYTAVAEDWLRFYATADDRTGCA